MVGVRNAVVTYPRDCRRCGFVASEVTRHQMRELSFKSGREFGIAAGLMNRCERLRAGREPGIAALLGFWVEHGVVGHGP